MLSEQNSPPDLTNVSPLPPTAPLASPALDNVGIKPPNNKSRKGLLVAALILLTVLMAGLYFVLRKPSVPATPALAKVTVRLEWVNNPEFAGMYVAQELGYYKANGLNVELKEFKDGTDVNKEVADGTVDYGVSTPLEVVLARDKSQKTKAVAAIYQTSAYAFAAQKKANINTPADFKGKILGASGGNNEAIVTYKALLGIAGISESLATLKPVDFDIEVVFKQNQADTYDIYRTDQTYLLAQNNIPYTVIYPEQYGFSIYGDVLIASDTKIARNPAQVGAFVSATLKGWQYAIDHQSETLAIIGKYMNQLYADPAYQKYDLSSTAQLVRPTGSQTLGNMQYVFWNRAYNGVKGAGLIRTTSDPSQFYTTQFVK